MPPCRDRRRSRMHSQALMMGCRYSLMKDWSPESSAVWLQMQYSRLPWSGSHRCWRRLAAPPGSPELRGPGRACNSAEGPGALFAQEGVQVLPYRACCPSMSQAQPHSIAVCVAQIN